MPAAFLRFAVSRFLVSMASAFLVESRHDAIVQFKGFNGSKVFEDLKDLRDLKI